MSKDILIVDDSPSVRRMVTMTLSQAQFEVHEAENGAEGLRMSRTKRFDMVITDQNMPVMTGLEFIRAFRGEPQNRGIPIVFLSTESAISLKEEARSAGALGWMQKPFEPTQLLAVVRKVLG
ncbi:response regulator [Pseudoprimorskyibacter insulae]|uniref:Chemotaxis protein CheY n=1 Tax=Pseudoprimorskyibacter insulae TaxID=1695997 RepID=A0A2R8ANW6_9RHOB|nr:response regulator [Pseudoprimorskyibacter insulae]SPF77587.1 Chemotaxis protein CheY [Pseudoprimorskyibacter insulae]